MTGFWVSFRTTDGKICKIEIFGQIFIKMVQKSYPIGNVFAHSYIRYCLAREPQFIHRSLIMYIFSENVSNHQLQRI